MGLIFKHFEKVVKSWNKSFFYSNFYLNVFFRSYTRWDRRFTCRFRSEDEYENLSFFREGFLDVSTSDEVWVRLMLRKSFSNAHTMLREIIYVKGLFDFLVCTPVLFVPDRDLLLQLIYFRKWFLNLLHVVVHFYVLQKSQSVILNCWHGLNFKYLFLPFNLTFN